MLWQPQPPQLKTGKMATMFLKNTFWQIRNFICAICAVPFRIK